MRRIIIYGDIEGCLKEFISLRKKIKPQHYDREIVVGDILDKGPYSNLLLKYIIKNNIESVMGNHEYKYVRYHNFNLNKQQKDKNPINLTSEQLAIYNNLSKKDIFFISNLPFYIKINNLTILHAGIINNIKLESATKKELEKILWIRKLDENQKLISLIDESLNYKFWSEYYDGNQGFIIYGHSVLNEVKYDKNSIGIDTSCVYGNKLTACIIHNTENPMDRIEIIQVNALKKYLNKYGEI